MTQMDLLVSNVAELLATAVHEVLRLMGQAVSEYRDESARIRQENQKLQRTLQELQNRLQISDAVQQVSSSVAAEEPLYESHRARVPDCHSEREPVETEENEEADSYKPSLEEEKPSALHLRAETREPDDACDFSHKRRRSLSSSRSRSASPEAPGVLNAIKTESTSDFPERSLSDQTENANTDAHLRLPYYLVHVNPAHVTWDASVPPRAENAADAGGPFGVAVRRENSHACHVCGKSFATASSLGAHFVCHSGERPFACERCKFRFSRLADLKKHERIHTGEKPYNCALCGRRFNRTENLRRHLRKVHHGALL
ncbi:zinc finger protein Gfi-1b isoform X2 [Ictalurus punctatus]|nr:zinc finger protein Gfi-1b isoform X2 [Ictalurus punctatus]XP_017342621.1 zinc finger protein Gfi-1b isoform X2 [Ictalurus punctatus]